MSLKKRYYSNKRKLFKYSSLFPNKTFKICESYVKCELLTAVTMKVVLWNVTPCSQQTHAKISQQPGAYFFMALPFTRRQQVPLKLALFTQLSIIHNPMQLEDI
jgi:BarA-like signal transduction histidine kinase